MNNLIKLVKAIVEKEKVLSVHPILEKMAFDAIIANVDKMEKVKKIIFRILKLSII